MERYKNLGGDSGVHSYEIASDSIKVQFNDSSIYLYNNSKPGYADTEMLKQLAVSGQGLNSYIGRHVKKNYATKLR